jgi:hypothetical protein
MSKKDYIKLADAIKQAVDRWGKTDALWMAADRIAMVCRYDNPAFNRDKFMEACGL